MPVYRTTCPHCNVAIKYNERLFNQTRPCPNCRRPILLQPPTDAEMADAMAAALDNLASPGLDPGEAMPPEPPVPVEAPPPPFEGPLMPERMKANRVLAGRVCRECNIPIELGDEVYNCQRCGATMHLGCHEKRGGCARCAVAAAPTAVAPPAGGPAPEAVQPAATGPTRACRYCGEQILAGAQKCRYCGEYQSGFGPPPRGGVSSPYRHVGNVNTHLVGAILTTLFCCQPFGIVAIVFAALAESKKSSGDGRGAMDLAAKANTWMIVALACGAGLWILYGMIFLMSVGMNRF
jgi:hypothetical protein